MKNSFASRVAVAFLVTGVAAGSGVHGATMKDGLICLERANLPCAKKVLDDLGPGKSSQDLLAARVAFHEGNFGASVERYRSLQARKPELFEQGGVIAEQFALAEATFQVHQGLVESVRGDITIVHHPGVDRILVEEAVAALREARRRIVPFLGEDTPVPLRVEIYPDAMGFTTCSSLPLEAVQTTGVVAISKWDRLMIHSPRALGRGYDWKDTLVHEWIHQVIAWNSHNAAPVWLHEGIAKSHDMRWRKDGFDLPVHMQSALAKGLRDDDFVGFEEMRYSFAFLDSADRASLAYAQVSTQIAFLQESAGKKAAAGLLRSLADGNEVEDAVAEVYGKAFGQFLEDWKQWLGTLTLVQESLATLPTVLSGEEDGFAQDPVLAKRKDLARKTRLGDLMRGRGHLEAALATYREAMPDPDPAGPLLVHRTAAVLVELGREEEAINVLRKGLEHYPEVAANNRLLGFLLQEQGRNRAATKRLQAAADLDPFHLELQQALAELHEVLGNSEQAEVHRWNIRVLEYRESG
jgi:tetratricopeptide (TPR) repeat protein